MNDKKVFKDHGRALQLWWAQLLTYVSRTNIIPLRTSYHITPSEQRLMELLSQIKLIFFLFTKLRSCKRRNNNFCRTFKIYKSRI